MARFLTPMILAGGLFAASSAAAGSLDHVDWGALEDRYGDHHETTEIYSSRESSVDRKSGLKIEADDFGLNNVDLEVLEQLADGEIRLIDNEIDEYNRRGNESLSIKVGGSEAELLYDFRIEF